MVSGSGATPATVVEGWLGELGIVPLDHGEREGAHSWDLLLHGRRRRDVRVTLILQPDVACIAWVHYAPPIGDGFRRSYRQLLRWNDELPFAKFGLAEDERLVLTAELAADGLDRDRLGLALARLLGMCDLLLDASRQWIWPLGTQPAPPPEASPSAVLERYGGELAELARPVDG